MLLNMFSPDGPVASQISIEELSKLREPSKFPDVVNEANYQGVDTLQALLKAANLRR